MVSTVIDLSSVASGIQESLGRWQKRPLYTLALCEKPLCDGTIAPVQRRILCRRSLNPADNVTLNDEFVEAIAEGCPNASIGKPDSARESQNAALR
jgi:hypothetical protein